MAVYEYLNPFTFEANMQKTRECVSGHFYFFIGKAYFLAEDQNKTIIPFQNTTQVFHISFRKKGNQNYSMYVKLKVQKTPRAFEKNPESLLEEVLC